MWMDHDNTPEANRARLERRGCLAAAKRRREFLKGKCKNYTVAEVCRMFGISDATARNDASLLREKFKRAPRIPTNQHTQRCEQFAWESKLPEFVRQELSRDWLGYRPELVEEYREAADA